METKDPTDLSQPLTKLLEVIEKGVGTVSRSYFIRKTAEAKADELKAIAEAHARTVALLTQSGNAEGQGTAGSPDWAAETRQLTERSESRARFKVQQAQANVEAVCAEAAESLSGVPAVPDIQLEPDWITRFFKLAEEISGGEMQQLWGRLLAGEVRRPGLVSLRMLDALRNLSRPEAELFSRFGRLAIHPHGKGEPMVLNPDKLLNDTFGISPGDILALKELGLVQQETFLQGQLDPKGAGNMFFEYANHAVLMKWEKAAGQINLPVLVFTRTGRELLPLVAQNFDLAYIEKFCRLLKSDGCTFEYGPIVERSQTGVKLGWKRPLLEEPTPVQSK